MSLKALTDRVFSAVRRKSRKSRNKPRGSRGMTLMELLVVMIIIAIIGLFAIPAVLNQLSKSRIKAAEIQVKSLGTILDMYRLDLGRYPSTTEGLEALISQPPGLDRWAGPYLRDRASLTDPWGNPYEYRAPGDHGEYDLWSNGSDGTTGGDGEATDITSW